MQTQLAKEIITNIHLESGSISPKEWDSGSVNLPEKVGFHLLSKPAYTECPLLDLGMEWIVYKTYRIPILTEFII